MALGSQLPVRLEPEIEEKLEKVATRIGTSKSALLRLLARTFVEHMIKPDGTVQLPPQWLSVLPPVDKRSATQPAATVPAVQQSPEALVRAMRKVKAKARKLEQEQLRPLAEQLERIKEANDRLEAQMKGISLPSKKMSPRNDIRNAP